MYYCGSRRAGQAAAPEDVPIDKPVIGIVGGIGAGKSRVAAALAAEGCSVIDSDALNHAVLREPAVVQTLVDWWGPTVRGPDGAADRSVLADLVFREPAARARLQELVYPLIARRRAAIIKDVEADPSVLAIVLDSPLLFESQLDRLCDAIIFVHADAARRLERLTQTRNWSEAEWRRREAAQLSLDTKRARADFVLDNSGNEANVAPQVRSILAAVLAAHGRQ